MTPRLHQAKEVSHTFTAKTLLASFSHAAISSFEQASALEVTLLARRWSFLVGIWNIFWLMCCLITIQLVNDEDIDVFSIVK